MGEDANTGFTINVNGPKVYLSVDLPFFGEVALITQTTVTILVATIVLMILAAVVTRKLTKRPSGLQVIAEKLVGMLYGLVRDVMGEHNLKYAPYIGTLFLSSITCTLLGMTGILRPATADLSVTLAWALITTVMVWYNSIKSNGFLGWLKGFTEPIVVMTPMNIVSEIAQPVSMAFRHFGNVAAGTVINTLVYGALSAASALLFGWLPGLVGSIPFLTAGIPAFLSLYFDLFSGFVQAFVFSLLTMVYVGTASPPPIKAAEEKEAVKE